MTYPVNFPECECFTGRKKQICRDESELPKTGPHSTDGYRIAWGLSPLHSVSPVYSRPQKRLGRYIGGAGTELKALLGWFGQYASVGCNCEKHAEAMDDRGIEWCKKNIETIVSWLKTEAADKKVLGFSMDRVPGFEYSAKQLIALAIANAESKLQQLMAPPFPAERGRDPFAYLARGTPEFVTLERLQQDIRELASKIHPSTSRIVGVARSGVGVAANVAMLLHLPLSIVRQSAGDMIDAGNGWRLTGNIGGQGPVVVIDDTVMTGNSFKHVMPIVLKTFPQAVSAAVYVNPATRLWPDLYVRELPHPHLLEWNLMNSIFSSQTAVDFDGILCSDCAPQDDDDGERYRGFLLTATPKYMIRKTRIPLIVTARLERWRKETEQWLAWHGMAADQIIMGPWANNQERSRADIGAWKGGHYKAFMRRHHRRKPPLFIESEERQAKRIAQVSGGIVVCPAAGRCF
jgi:hypoxanthine phosphoribosyltransferase